MDGLTWGVLLGFLGTALLAAGGFYGHHVYRTAENAKVKVAESEASVDAQRIKLEGWAEIVASLQTERSELNKIIERKDATIEAKDATIDRLRGQLVKQSDARRRAQKGEPIE